MGTVGGDDPDGDADDDLPEHSSEGEHRCDRQRPHDLGAHRPSLEHEGSAQVAVRETAEIGDVLRQDRVVEAELAGDQGDRHRSGIRPGNQPGRVAGDDIGEEEGERDHAEDDDDHLQETPHEPAGHRPISVVTGSSRSVSQSPARLNASTVMMRAMPGAIRSQGAIWKYCWPWEIIWPQDASGTGTPMPR